MKYTDFIRAQLNHMQPGDITIVDIGDKPLSYFRVVLSKLYGGLFKTCNSNGVITAQRVDQSSKPVHHVKPLLWGLEIGQSVLIDSPDFNRDQLRQAVYIVNKMSNRKFRTKEVPITMGSDHTRLFAQRKGDKL